MTEDISLLDSIKEAHEEIISLQNGEETGAIFHMPDSVDVKAIRKKMGLTQIEFSKSIDLPLSTLKKYEAGTSKPDRLGRAFFTVLEKNPRAVIEALH